MEGIEAIHETMKAAARAAGKLVIEHQGASVAKTKINQADLVTWVDQECQRTIESMMREKHPSHFLLGEETVETIKVTPELMDQCRAREWLWIVDPIDGTTNFVHSLPLSVISIGLAHYGEVVAGVIYDPYRDDLYHCIQGRGAFCNGEPIHVRREGCLKESLIAFGINYTPQAMMPLMRGATALSLRCRSLRMCGSAALNLAWTACGKFNAWFELDLSPWDVSAGSLLVMEAGGRVTNFQGTPYSFDTISIVASSGVCHDEILSILSEAKADQLD